MVRRRVFFSFKYGDIWRVNAIRNQSKLAGVKFLDGSLNESSKAENEEYIERKIKEGLKGTSVTVFLVTSKTKNSKYVKYEYHESVKKGNDIVQLNVSKMKDPNGRVTTFTGWLPYVRPSYKKKWTPGFRLDEYLDEKLG